MTTQMNGHDPALEEDEFSSYAPPDLSNFNHKGELVTGNGPGSTTDAEYFAYSTILAEGLKPQKDTEIEFMKTAALKDPMQQLALDKHISWFQFVYNAPVCNRYGLVEVTQERIHKVLDEAEDHEDEDEQAEMLSDITRAGQLAEEYHRQKAIATHLMSLPTAGMEKSDIEDRKKLWEQTQIEMRNCDEEATELYSGARGIYQHTLYILWVEAWIAADERQGLPVAQYDFTELKRAFREKTFSVFDAASRMPMAWRIAHQMCQVSLSSGEEWRQMFTVTITRGIGQLPTPERQRRPWWQRIGRRNPDQETLRTQQMQQLR